MIEIIPKPTEKIFPWQKFFFYVSLGLLALVVLSYLTLALLENKASVSLRNLEEETSKVGTPEEKTLEAEVLVLDKKIKGFLTLLSEYRKSSNFFEVLEKSSHPKIWFSELNLQVDAQKAVISGKTPNFQTLGQQLIIFQSQNWFENVNLSHLSIAEDGEVDFTVNLSLPLKLFK